MAKKPSAKQIAARKKFAAAVKSGAFKKKAAASRKKNKIDVVKSSATKRKVKTLRMPTNRELSDAGYVLSIKAVKIRKK